MSSMVPGKTAGRVRSEAHKEQVLLDLTGNAPIRDVTDLRFYRIAHI